MSVTSAQPTAVRGDPDALDDLGLICRRAAWALRDDVSRLRGADVADWSGEASRAFTRSLHGLPGDLTRAADSYDTVARALSTYATDLRAVQHAARRAETELADLGGMLLADRAYLIGGLDPASDAARTRRITAHEEEQQAVRCRLAGLGDDASLSAGAAACRVRSACDAPQAPPSLFERLADGVGDWVQDHAQGLEDLSLALKGISTVAGVLALVPALTPICAPIGMAAGVAALAIDAALASRGRASWKDVSLGAVFTAIPAARPTQVAYREVRTRLGSVVVYRVEGTPNTRISIDAGNNVAFRGRTMLHVTVGDRARAEAYFQMKKAGGLPGVQLKSFRIPKRVHRQLSIQAVDQHLAKAFRGRPQRVDVSTSREQYGLRRTDFRELEKNILPGSGKVLR